MAALDAPVIPGVAAAAAALEETAPVVDDGQAEPPVGPADGVGAILDADLVVYAHLVGGHTPGAVVIGADPDVDAGPPMLPPPPSWVALVRELLAEQDLAPLFLDEPEHAVDVEGRLWLHPWRPRRDVGALLDWVAHMEGPVSVSRPGPGANAARRGFGLSWDTVWVDGLLAGHPTRLVAHTHRLPTEPMVATTEDLLLAIARQEDAAADPQLDDVEGLDAVEVVVESVDIVELLDQYLSSARRVTAVGVPDGPG